MEGCNGLVAMDWLKWTGCYKLVAEEGCYGLDCYGLDNMDWLLWTGCYGLIAID